jgi:dihydrofolate reductase
MHRIIAIEFTTLDGVVEDPDGSFGSPIGGWALRHGPEAFAGDKFQLGRLMETGALLFGRRTWTLFADRWPARSGGFADAMNAAAKLVASRTLADVSAWSNSALVEGDLYTALDKERTQRDVVVVGSTSIVHELTARSMIDEYRLLVFPTTAGRGTRYFAPDAEPPDLRLVSAEDAAGGTALLRYERVADGG